MILSEAVNQKAEIECENISELSACLEIIRNGGIKHWSNVPIEETIAKCSLVIYLDDTGNYGTYSSPDRETVVISGADFIDANT